MTDLSNLFNLSDDVNIKSITKPPVPSSCIVSTSQLKSKPVVIGGRMIYPNQTKSITPVNKRSYYVTDNDDKSLMPMDLSWPWFIFFSFSKDDLKFD